MEKLLEVSVVAIRLNVSDKTVVRMLADPTSPLEGVQVHKKCYRVFASSVEKLLAQRRVAA
jgi:hypothetical protein